MSASSVTNVVNRVQELEIGFKRALVRLGDLAAVSVAFLFSFWLRTNWSVMAGQGGPWQFEILDASMLPRFESILYTAWLVVLVVFHNTERGQRMRTLHYVDEVFLVVRAMSVSFVILLAATSLYSRHAFSRATMILFYVMSIVAVSGWRLFVKSCLRTLRRHGLNWVKVLVVGTGDAARTVQAELERHREFGYRLVGFVETDPRNVAATINGSPVLGTPEDINRLVGEHGVNDVVIALPSAPKATMRQLLELCILARVRVVVVPDLIDLATARMSLSHMGTMPLLEVSTGPLQGWEEALKRAFDFAMACLGLVLLSPVFALLALLIRLDSPGPVFFSQRRVGRFGRVFTILKFRSMYVDAEARRSVLDDQNEVQGGVVFKMKDDPRITSVGRFMRRFSLDELPQLINVLMGDMSLVGPRPPLESEVHLYPAAALDRLNIVPGLTGLWQVSGRSDLSFERMVELDLEYIHNWSLWNDIKLIARTIPVVLSGRGAY